MVESLRLDRTYFLIISSLHSFRARIQAMLREKFSENSGEM